VQFVQSLGKRRALKPCKASGCWQSCVTKVSYYDKKSKKTKWHLKGWCYLGPEKGRCYARASIEEEDGAEEEQEEEKDGTEEKKDGTEEEDEEDEASTQEDEEDEEDESGTKEDDDEDDDEDDEAEDHVVEKKKNPEKCKICCEEGKWCEEMHTRFRYSLSGERRKIVRGFNHYHERMPYAPNGLLLMRGAQSKRHLYLEKYGVEMNSEEGNAGVQFLKEITAVTRTAVPWQCSSGSITGQQQLDEIAKTVDGIVQFIPAGFGDTAEAAKAYLSAVQVRLVDLVNEVKTMAISISSDVRGEDGVLGTPMSQTRDKPFSESFEDDEDDEDDEGGRRPSNFSGRGLNNRETAAGPSEHLEEARVNHSRRFSEQ